MCPAFGLRAFATVTQKKENNIKTVNRRVNLTDSRDPFNFMRRINGGLEML